MSNITPDDGFPLPHLPPDYMSPPALRRPLSALFPSLSFYVRVFLVVRAAGAKAARGEYTAEDWIGSSLETLRALEYCGVVLEIRGLEHLAHLNGPCVVVSNHMSTLETFILPCVIQPHKDVTFVIKEDLLKYPWFGNVLRARDPITVGRADPRADLNSMLKGGAERLGAGISIIVFPQGSRGPSFDPRHFNSVGVKIARKAGVPVLPLALRSDAWGVGKIVKDFGPIRPQLRVRFKFGPPLSVAGNGKEEHATVLRFIQDNLASWGIDAPYCAVTE
ncbi:MAG: 1-acyl-sn-glycerol-3-phosphate acyltransferase [Deltaproteobacteria bacterium]|jgi:1-acyl-sn-glycerol-3-phosphate acyltransferase|nr:1-acyl-sn-glycerol-3-phosphate acyltransferase [Deltaproteobacteria bacterium]